MLLEKSNSPPFTLAKLNFSKCPALRLSIFYFKQAPCSAINSRPEACDFRRHANSDSRVIRYVGS